MIAALLRPLVRAPGFSALVVFTLALGIGANTAIFSVLHATLLSPLPYREPARLVRVWGSGLGQGIDRTQVSFPKFEMIAAQTEIFESAGAATFASLVVTGRGDPEQVPGLHVSAGLLPTLGAPPAAGRYFLPEEDQEGGPPVALLSFNYWQRRFGGDPGIVGTVLTINDVPHTIVGVLPPKLTFPFARTSIWRPKVFAAPGVTPAAVKVGAGYLEVTARLRPGVTAQQATEALKLVAQRYREANAGNMDARFDLQIIPLLDELTGDQRPALLLLFGAVGLVLLIACANVANLLLARFTVRRREVAVRAALGASRSRLTALFLGETMLLTLLAALVGGWLAHGLLGVVVRHAAPVLPRAAEIELSPAVLAFTLGLSVFTGLLLGLVPAWSLGRTHLNDVLKDAGRGSSGSGGRLRRTLLVAEVAVSFALLVGAALLLGSFVRLLRVDAGFDPRGVFFANLSLPATRYDTPEKRRALIARLQERVTALPGVQAAALGVGVPLTGADFRTPYHVEGAAPADLAQRPLTIFRAVTPGYLAATGIALRSGRDFTARDDATAPPVVMISESLARRLFPGENPLGRRLFTGQKPVAREIIGVVGDTRSMGLATPPRDEIYLALAQLNSTSFGLVARTSGEPAQLAAPVRGILKELDPQLPLADVGSLEWLVELSLANQRLVLQLIGAFAGLALLLASVGIYGVMSYTVAQRTSELGIRLALGAEPAALRRMVLREGMRVVLLGLLLGAAASAGLSRVIAAHLFGVSPFDAPTYAGVAALLAIAAALACWVPARRATQVDPLVALRAE
jgi:predicted permease